MKKFFKTLLKIIKWILIVLLAVIVLFLIVRNIGRALNNRTPKGGINETMYVDVNGQQMWINIYGENRDDPLLLYLHGGAGQSTSYDDYVILRKLAKDYTVVNWDQRNCGKTWLKDPQDTTITIDMMREDIDVLTDYLLDHMGKEKLTVMGISWGSFYALDFAQNHPEKTECCIGLSQFLGCYEGGLEYNLTPDRICAEFFKTTDKLPPEAAELTEKLDVDAVMEKLAAAALDNKLDEALETDEDLKIYNELLNNYEKQVNAYLDEIGFNDECDESIVTAVLFSPYYTIPEIYRAIVSYPKAANGQALYNELNITTNSSSGPTLLGRTEYEMPVYMFLGDNDTTCDPQKAEEYFNSISAPDKMLRYTSGGHIATMYNSEELAEFIHEIAERQKSADK